MHKKSGFTLMELLVAATIFGLVIIGLSSVFVAGNKHMIHARERMSSAALGKFFLDPLQNQIRQDTWAGSELAAATGIPSALVSLTINKRLFQESHIVTGISSVPNLRRVVSTINWTEPSS